MRSSTELTPILRSFAPRLVVHVELGDALLPACPARTLVVARTCWSVIEPSWMVSFEAPSSPGWAVRKRTCVAVVGREGVDVERDLLDRVAQRLVDRLHRERLPGLVELDDERVDEVLQPPGGVGGHALRRPLGLATRRTRWNTGQDRRWRGGRAAACRRVEPRLLRPR